MKVWGIALGLGAVIGAVAILMMPRENLTRKLASQTASKLEETANKISNKLSNSEIMH